MVNYVKIYSALAKILAGGAGAIILSVTVGIHWAVIGFFMGFIVGHCLAKLIIHQKLAKN